MLYQLSYFRVRTSSTEVGADGFEPPKSKDSRFTVCPIWPLWKTPLFVEPPFLSHLFESASGRASCRIRTNDPEITNHVLWPTELKRQIFAAAEALDSGRSLKRLQRYDVFLNLQNFSEFFLSITAFFLEFLQLDLQRIHTLVNTFLKSVTGLLHIE